MSPAVPEASLRRYEVHSKFWSERMSQRVGRFYRAIFQMLASFAISDGLLEPFLLSDSLIEPSKPRTQL
jgi:hypothetical protein